MSESILLQNVNLQQLAGLFKEEVKSQLNDFKKELLSHKADDDLLSRSEACEYLKIDSSTLWHWQNKGKVKAYGLGKRRYYKRNELLEILTPLKK